MEASIEEKAKYVRIPKVSSGPWVDGILRDEAWKKAVKIGPLIAVDSADRAPYATEVYACHDGENLFVGWICSDPDIRELRSEKRAISDRTQLDDTVRLWLDANLEHLPHAVWQIMVNPTGSLYRDIGGDLSTSYNDMYGWEGEAKVERAKGLWSAELKVSFSLLGLDLAGRNIIGFNPGRCFRGRDIYSWVTPDGNVATGWGFAIIETGDEALTARSKKRVQWLVARKARQKSGRGLPLEPGYHRTCNKEVGIMLFGPDHRPTLWVGKSDVWDRRLLIPDEKEHNVTLKELREAAFAGKDAEARLAELHRRTNAPYGAYQFPSPKPAGEIIIGLPFRETVCTTEVNVEDGGIGVEDAKKSFHLRSVEGEKKVEMRIYLHPYENAVVVDGEAENMEGEEFFFRIYRHRDVIRPGKAYRAGYNDSYDYSKDYPDNKALADPVAGRDGEVIWVSQDFPAERTFPRGFRVVIAGAVSGGKTSAVEVTQMNRDLGTKLFGQTCLQSHYWPGWQRTYNAAPGSASTVRVKIAEDGNFRAVFALVTTRDDSKPEKAAVKLVRRMLSRSSEELWREYTESTRKDYIAGYDYTGDIPVCTVLTSRFCAGDSTPWHGDFHFNEIADPGQFTEYFVRGRADELEPYFQLIEKMMPPAKRYARYVFNSEGAAFTCAHFPLKAEMLIQHNLPWDFSMEMTAAVMKPFWQHYLYLQDEEFLRKRAYPILREGAIFYARYLTPGEDGYYHVIPTVSPEHWTFTPEFRLNRDSQSALTLIKYHLRATARAARILGLDAEEAARWEEMAGKIAPYPTYWTPQGEMFVDVADAPPIKGLNISVPLTAVFWGDDIGLDSPAQLQDIARRTLDFVISQDRNGLLRENYRQSTSRRLGIPDGLGTESLLQSYNGVIRLFPAVPAGYTGRFENLLAVGAFSVSGKMEKGEATDARIVSNSGNACRVANPWPGCSVEVIEERENKPVSSGKGRYIEFGTSAGKAYLLQKMG